MYDQDTAQMAVEKWLHRCSVVAAPRASAAGTATLTQEAGEIATSLDPYSRASAVGRILVVDDDPTICTLIEPVLRSENFGVTTAENGYRAIDLFRRDAGICVVILDWRMPGISGEQVFDTLVAVRPDVKVIVATGDTPADVHRAFSGRKVHQFLSKPFTIQSLVIAVKSAVAG